MQTELVLPFVINEQCTSSYRNCILQH